MSSTMKFSLLALVSTAAAVPHYGAHSKFHKPSGSGSGNAYPTGGWWRNRNSTAVYPTGYPTGTGVYDDTTTTIHETFYSTQTVVQTIYATRPAGSSVEVKDVSSTGAAACGPETVYVTATNKVTVTVGAGNAASSDVYTPVPSSKAEEPAYTPASSAAEVISSVAEAISSAPGYSAAPAPTPIPSSSAAAYESFISIPNKGVEKPSEVSQVAYPTQAPVVSSAAPSSAAPSAAPTSPSYSGGKRGLAYNDVTLTTPFEGKVSFAYNWGAAENGKLPTGAKYIPMCHRPNLYPSASDWFSKVEAAVKGGSNAVMGFNEPDHAEQANLTPEQACTAWNTYLNPIVEKFPGVTIIGPSVTNGPAPMGLDWLSRFTKACPGAVWHAANIHFYDIYDANTLSRFKTHIEKAASQCGGKKIWVTEFGLNPGSATAAQAAEFLKGAMEYLDGNDAVQGYSYFMVGVGENMLNSAKGLSSVGSVYAS